MLGFFFGVLVGAVMFFVEWFVMAMGTKKVIRGYAKKYRKLRFQCESFNTETPPFTKYYNRCMFRYFVALVVSISVLFIIYDKINLQ